LSNKSFKRRKILASSTNQKSKTNLYFQIFNKYSR
jgi:hypothetical protein